jgi:hypothetical protein
MATSKPDTYLPRGRPAYAQIMWMDDAGDIFVELPCKDAPPYIQKFSGTEGGLSKALETLRNARPKPKPSYAREEATPDPNAVHPLVVASKAKAQEQFTAEQRTNALAVLRKLGMV